MRNSRRRRAIRSPDADDRVRASQQVVEHAIDDPGCVILDVRTDAEYRGERFWPSGGLEEGGRPGHVPSAVLVPADGLQDADGAFRPAGDLRRLYSPIDLAGDHAVIPYCTIGGRASTTWFVLTYLLGYHHAASTTARGPSGGGCRRPRRTRLTGLGARHRTQPDAPSVLVRRGTETIGPGERCRRRGHRP
jgi:rhodanese-related sulfurtransferase